ncbi:MAG: hypothetical protein HY902_17755 [Deltaproteobacteria bacterium]|nr:hypothetical protein [Deltaproteobacteria bacterium]
MTFVTNIWIHLLSAALFCAVALTATSGPAFAEAATPLSLGLPELTPAEAKQIKSLATMTREILEECYVDHDNERDPHEPPDWCAARTKKVLKAVGNNRQTATLVVVRACYSGEFFADSEVRDAPEKLSGDEDWNTRLASGLRQLIDEKLLVAYLIHSLATAAPAGKKAVGDSVYRARDLAGALSWWTGWRTCDFVRYELADTGACRDAWQLWWQSHGGEQAGMWQELAEKQRLADLRSGNPEKQLWAMDRQGKGGKPIPDAYFAEVAWVLHDALLPNKLPADVAQRFESAAKAYGCSTRCVVFPPPLAGRTLPTAPLALAEGKPVLRALPPRPSTPDAVWPDVPVDAKAKARVKKDAAALAAIVSECQSMMSESSDYDVCGPATERIDQLLESKQKSKITQVLWHGYLGKADMGRAVGHWHTPYSGDDSGGYLEQLLAASDTHLLMTWLFGAYNGALSQAVAAQPGKLGPERLQQWRWQILAQMREITHTTLCEETPWGNRDPAPCYGMWSAWWAQHKDETTLQWRAAGFKMRREDFESDDLARRYGALLNLPDNFDLEEVREDLAKAARWSLRDVLLDAATPAEAANAFDAIAADHSCGFRCVAFPPPLAGRTAPALPALVSAEAPRAAAPARSPGPPPDSASAAELRTACRAHLQRFQAQEGLAVCEQAAAKDPANLGAQLALGWATLDARDAGAALAAAQKVSALPNLGSLRAEAQLLMAAALTVAGRADQARPLLEQAARAKSTRAAAKIRLELLAGAVPSGAASSQLVAAARSVQARSPGELGAFLLRRGWTGGVDAWNTATGDL